ncbi:MAG: outer membrane protein assembly factor BamB [Gammaproteobacteria bacterium]|nr:outer membrane protein assembly factor BamB [Gammaproteobacteria bacterium]
MKLISKVVKYLVVINLVLLCGCSSYKPAPPAPLVNFKPTMRVKTAWTKHIGDGAKEQYLKLTPTYVNNTIFVDGYNGELAAMDAQTGNKIWAINTKVHLTSGVGAGNGMLFVGDDKGQLLAFKQKNGAFAWHRSVTSQILATPTVAGNIVLVKAENGVLTAFNIDNGKQLWTYTNEEPSLILRGGSSPQVFGSRIVTGFASGDLVVLDLKSGQYIWRELVAEGEGSMAVQRMVDIDVNPQIINGIIYVASYQGKVAAVSLKTGKTLWQHKLSSYSGLAVDNAHVYVSDDQGSIWAFDRINGRVVWKQNDLANRKITGPALLGSNVLVVGDGEGYIHFIACNDGHFVARALVRKKDSILSEPITYSNNVFIYTKGGYLARFVVGS